MERLIIIDVPKDVLDKKSISGKFVIQNAKKMIINALITNEFIFESDAVKIAFRENERLNIDTPLRPMRIITTFGDGVELDEIAATIEVVDIDRNN